MTLNEWFAAWSHVLPPQAAADLVAALDPTARVLPEPSGQSESAVQADIRLVASRDYGVALWRNNRGALTDKTGRLVRFGLGNESDALDKNWKSSDLVGVQRGTGRFVAIEVKAPGWHLTPGDHRAQAQAAFIKSVIGLGGIAGFAQSVDDFRRTME